jgi:hypothetical protein
VAVINEDLNIGIHPPPTVGLIIQTVGNQRVAASIWQTDYGDGQAGLVDPAYALQSFAVVGEWGGVMLPA